MEVFCFRTLNLNTVCHCIVTIPGGIVAQLCLTLVTPWTIANQVLLSMGFPRQEYWNGLPFSSSRGLADSGMEPRSPALQAISCVAGSLLHCRQILLPAEPHLFEFNFSVL